MAAQRDALCSNRADPVIGMSGDGPTGGGYTTRLLGEVAWVFTVAPDHPLAAAAEPVAESERLARCAIVVADSSRHLPPRSAGLLNGQATLTVHNRAAQLEAQRMGLGVGPLPRPVAERKTAAERVLIKRTGDGRATFVFDAA